MAVVDPMSAEPMRIDPLRIEPMSSDPPPRLVVDRTMPPAPDRQVRGFVHLRARADFLRTAKGARFHTAAFSLQAAPSSVVAAPARFGLTVTKKTAPAAVRRNRIRRRLREAVRAAVNAAAPGHDYVLVGRPEALVIDFRQLVDDLVRALGSIHARRRGQRHGAPPAMRVRPADLGAIAGSGRAELGQAELGQPERGQVELGKDQ